MEVNNESGSVIEVVDGYKVKQIYNQKVGRFYVWLPKRSGLRELYGKKERMFRSHYVFLRMSGLNKIPKSFVIHHKDHNRTNDNYSNLEMMTIEAHNAYHENHLFENPPQPPFLGRNHTEETRLKMSRHAIGRGNNDVWGGPKKGHFKETIEKISTKASGSGNAMYRHDLDNEAIQRCYKITGSLGETARIFGCSMQAVRLRLRQENSSDWKSLSDEELLCELNEAGNLHRLSLKLNAPQTSLWRKIKRIENERS